MFVVEEPPRYGYLEIEPQNIASEDGKEELVTSFDQAIIDSGRLHYVQATANQTRDSMIVDVTNGITWLHGLIVSFKYFTMLVPNCLQISMLQNNRLFI